MQDDHQEYPEDYGAFIARMRPGIPEPEQAPGPDQAPEPERAPGPAHARNSGRDGPLAGLAYAAKDLIDVAGLPTTSGSPEFATWRGTPARNAWVIDTLAGAGAELVGKTHLHELAYGITGINAHYGTPRNPAAPGRIPGGSSSGSAVAVAGGLVDFALGTDTGGSIRAPASFCGLFGFRPTHGHIPTAGVAPLAPSFDTVGVFTRDAELLGRATRALLRPPAAPAAARLERAIVGVDGLELVAPAAQEAALRVVEELARVGLDTAELATGLLVPARDTQRVLQGAEAWAMHREWLESAAPRLGRDVAGLLEDASRLTPTEVGRASADRPGITLELERLLGADGLLLLPAALGPAPALRDLADPDQAFRLRMDLLSLMNLGSLTGLPSVTLPAATPGELPVGVQLIGPRGSDLALLELAERLRL